MNAQEAKKLEKKCLGILQNHIKKDNKVIAGISGGPDSMFLLHFLVKLQKHTPFTIIAAHLNHKLRKKECDLDEEFIKRMVENFYNTKMILETKSINIANLSKKSKKGIEETGRTERYKFFNHLSQKYKATYITTAHHANDNLETIIMNFTRGSSIQGLSGMQELEGNLLRPLLLFSKKQITSYLKLSRIQFLTDKTNTDRTYKRNFIRHDIIPKLQKINPNLTETITKNAKNLTEINKFLQKSAQKWISRNSIDSKYTKFNAAPFRTQQPALQKTILLEIHKNNIGNTQNIESAHLDEVVTLIQKNIGNKKKKLGRLVISVKRNIFFIA